MTYPQALEFLGNIRRLGSKFGLENMRALASRMGNPQDRLRFIHIAGTNGKGSTAVFCAEALQAMGYRTGLYTSPHFIDLGERIQINRQPMPQEAIIEGIGHLAGLMKEGAEAPTFFEVITALALWQFEREGVEWVVWETGLGGNLDATNIVKPAVSVITSIGMDHSDFLGTTIEAIAGEKAGIIKPGIPVVSGVEEKKAAVIIEQSAFKDDSPLRRVGREIEFQDRGIQNGFQTGRIEGRDLELGLLGAHQVRNAACAWGAVEAVCGAETLAKNEERIGDAWKRAHWPGRFQVWRREPRGVLDGAHNVPATQALAETWHSVYGHEKYHLIWGILSDKDAEGMAACLRPGACRVSLVRVANERSAEPESLAKYFPDLPVRCFPSLREAWADASPDPVLITGSLFLLGEFFAMQGNGEGAFRFNELLRASPGKTP